MNDGGKHIVTFTDAHGHKLSVDVSDANIFTLLAVVQLMDAIESLVQQCEEEDQEATEQVIREATTVIAAAKARAKGEAP